MLSVVIILTIYTERQELSKDTEYTAITFRASSDSNGGALYASEFTLSIIQCTFNQCVTTRQGAAIYLYSTAHTFYSTDCEYCECASQRYGAIRASVDSPTMLRSFFASCSTTTAYTTFDISSSNSPALLDCCCISGSSGELNTWAFSSLETVQHSINVSHCIVQTTASELLLSGLKGPTELKFAITDSNTAKEGSVFSLQHIDSASTISHIASVNSTFGDTNRYFCLHSGTDPCISNSYFEIGRETELVYVYTGTPVLTLSNCWLGVSATYFSPATVTDCHFNAQTEIAFDGSCKFLAIHSSSFTKAQYASPKLMVTVGLLLTVEIT